MQKPADGYREFKDFEVQKMLRNLAYWRKNYSANAQQKNNFYAFFNEHDRRRGTSFEKTFPDALAALQSGNFSSALGKVIDKTVAPSAAPAPKKSQGNWNK